MSIRLRANFQKIFADPHYFWYDYGYMLTILSKFPYHFRLLRRCEGFVPVGIREAERRKMVKKSIRTLANAFCFS